MTATAPTREAVEAELKAKAASLVYTGDVWGAETTLGEALERWLATLGQEEGQVQRAQSVETYARAVRGVLLPRLGEIPLGRVTAPQLETFMGEMRTGAKAGAGYSVTYRLMMLRALRDALSMAVRMGALASNPALSVTTPSKRTRHRKPAKQALTPGQVGVLRRCIAAWEGQRRSGPPRGPQLRLSVELGLATGCRIGEVCGLLLDEATDLPTLQVAVTGTVIVVGGRLIRSPELKGADQARILELPDWARPVLNECRELAHRSGTDAPLLQGRGGALIAPANLRTRFRSMKEEYATDLESAGIRLDELSFHALRRTVITAVDRAHGRELAQAQAGHREAATTEGYIDTPTRLPIVAGAAKAIDDAFGRAS